MKQYNPLEIEAKWQAIWQANNTYQIDVQTADKKCYVAGMFPYPSGVGLHVGHVRNYSIVDVIARYQRQHGYKVLNPIGWDTFGLPAENYAIKTGVPPAQVTQDNINNFKHQLSRLGISYDWSKELSTSDPKYYKWTQWIFVELFNRGLAYQKESYQWWDPIDKTVLANEQVINGYADRSGAKVEKRLMKQWFFKITAYAEELLTGLDELDWPESIKAMQRNWIGKSEGAQVDFQLDGSDDKITVFTTRPDTLFGVPFLTLAPEHPLAQQLLIGEHQAKAKAYIEQSLMTSEIERMREDKPKTGVFSGSYAIHPITKAKIPIWIADYVLGSYGYGAVMGVPAHDQRDFDFAKCFDLPILRVVEAGQSSEEAYTGTGVLVNSGEYDNLDNVNAGQKIVEKLTELNCGAQKITYKMRDWLISRQRYWGAPIPIAYDSDGVAHAIPEQQLPVILPEVDNYKPDGSGRGVLARDQTWSKVKINGQTMTRETDTMDGYACSSWYLLRYLDPNNDKQAWSTKDADKWLPVDFYCGGDHAVAHLLYVRFWTMVFRDTGLVNFSEPIKKLVFNGYINAADGSKMSKSKGNTVDPLELINQGYGADALRVYELFIGPYNLDASWDNRGVVGSYRFLNRLWVLVQEFLQSDKQPTQANKSLDLIVNKTIKKVQHDLDNLSFNTAISMLMEAINELYKLKTSGFIGDWQNSLQKIVQLVEPFAPHIANELWQVLTGKSDLDKQVFPNFDESKIVSDSVTIAIQINGRVRAEISFAKNLSQEQVKELALAQENVKKHLQGLSVVKFIYVPSRIISIVAK